MRDYYTLNFNRLIHGTQIILTEYSNIRRLLINRIMEEFIRIDKEISLTSGTRFYQKKVLFILVLGEMSVSSFIMSAPFYFLKYPPTCHSSQTAFWMKNFRKSTFELSSLEDSTYQIAHFGTSYFIGVLLDSLILPWLADMYGSRAVVKYAYIFGIVFFITAAISFHMLISIRNRFPGIWILYDFLCIVYRVTWFKCRNWYLGIYKLFWAIAAIFHSIGFMLGLYWRYAIIFSESFLVLDLILLAYVFESSRYLLTNALYVKAATDVINNISVINGVGQFPYKITCEKNINASSSLIKLLTLKKLLLKLLYVGLYDSLWYCFTIMI